MTGLKAELDAMFAAAVSANRGASAPDNPFEGLFWWDTSGNPTEILKRYTVTAGWISLISVNITTGVFSFVGEAKATLTTAGDLLYASAANTLARLAKGAANQVLQMNSGATAFAWTTPSFIGVRDSARELIIKNNASHPTYQIDIDADEMILQDSSGNSVRVSAVDLTVDITVSGANGLDTGSEANDEYNLFVIYNPTTSTVAGLLSLSDNAPTLPAGYTFKGWYGAVFNVAGDFVNFHQSGKSVITADAHALTDGTSAGSIDLSASVPAKAKVVFGYCSVSHPTAGTCLASLSADGNLGYVSIAAEIPSGVVSTSSQFRITMITAQQIYYSSYSSSVVNVYVTGWEY
jgi:hypothetical protein